MKRKGMGKGLGKGYKNIVPIDSHIHSLSAKGISQKKIMTISEDIARDLDMREIMEEKDKNIWFKTYEDYAETLRMDVDVRKKRILVTENDDMSGSILNLNAKGDYKNFIKTKAGKEILNSIKESQVIFIYDELKNLKKGIEVGKGDKIRINDLDLDVKVKGIGEFIAYLVVETDSSVRWYLNPNFRDDEIIRTVRFDLTKKEKKLVEIEG